MGRYDALTKIEENQEKRTDLLVNQQTSKPAKKHDAKKPSAQISKAIKTVDPPTPKVDKVSDSSLLSTKEKTKYGTYLTDESIQKISIRAIQTNRKDHQVVQEAINQYFEKLEN